MTCELGFLRFDIHDKDIALVTITIILILSFIGNFFQCLHKRKPSIETQNAYQMEQRASITPILESGSEEGSQTEWNNQWPSQDQCSFSTFLG